jgi:hypothetical protein
MGVRSFLTHVSVVLLTEIFILLQAKENASLGLGIWHLGFLFAGENIQSFKSRDKMTIN